MTPRSSDDTLRRHSFPIVGGQVIRPVQSLRFTQNTVAALNEVESLSATGQLTENGYAPTVKIRAFSFTG